jgi:hypothetical protein
MENMLLSHEKQARFAWKTNAFLMENLIPSPWKACQWKHVRLIENVPLLGNILDMSFPTMCLCTYDGWVGASRSFLQWIQVVQWWDASGQLSGQLYW